MINFPLELYASYIDKFSEIKEERKKSILKLGGEHKFLDRKSSRFPAPFLLQDNEKEQLKNIISRKKSIEKELTELYREFITYKLYDIVINNEQNKYYGNIKDKFTESIVDYLKKELDLEKFEYFELSIIRQIIDVSQHIVSSTMYSPYYIEKEN